MRKRGILPGKSAIPRLRIRVKIRKLFFLPPEWNFDIANLNERHLPLDQPGDGPVDRVS